MKYLNTILALVLIMSCNTNIESSEKGVAKISGKILNTKDTLVSIMNEYGEILSETKIDSSSSFNLSINLNEPVKYYIAHYDELAKIYLEAGMDLKISLNYEFFDESISFKGKGSTQNNYLKNKFLLVEKIEDSEGIFSMNDLNKIKTYYVNKEDTLLSLLESYGFDKKSTFYKNEKSDIQFENYTSMIKRYNDLKSQAVDTLKSTFIKYDSIEITYERIRPDTLIIPNNYLDFLSEIDINSNDILKYEYFLLKLCEFDYWSNNTIADSVGYSEKARLEAEQMLDIINKRFENNKAKSLVIEQKLKSYVSNRLGVDILEPYFKQYLEIETDTQKRAKFSDIYESIRGLKPGSFAPEFTARDISGKIISLSDYKGKFVYVDIWATWCPPCRKEIPFLADLEYHMNDKNVVFISISLDKDSIAWANMVKDKNMKGIQLLADKAWNSDIAKSYVVKNIPRFLLIDPDGKIINQNASRPSQGAKDEIEKALKTL